MAVLLDTTELPWGERADAVCAALSTALAPASVSASPGARSRISRWDLGPGADLLQHVSGGHRLTRTGKHLRSDNPERISLGLPRAARCASSTVTCRAGIASATSSSST
ncbi:hypothetical protein ACFQ1L_25930 [Phytohabitans flavus]|uniref:hypothetical protein n=1 Tax=Phytohabitans flavus TaxID=1076124 RepID=UPI00362C3D1E